MKRILFLCTGNYYRSRFAEILFNHLAEQSQLPCRADSCGLRVHSDGHVNVGPLSVHTIQALAHRGIPLPPERFPRQVTLNDLTAAHLVIAVKEAEHRNMLATQFPAFTDQTRYWHVHDLDAATPAEALVELESLVKNLIAEIEARQSKIEDP